MAGIDAVKAVLKHGTSVADSRIQGYIEVDDAIGNFFVDPKYKNRSVLTVRR